MLEWTTRWLAGAPQEAMTRNNLLAVLVLWFVSMHMFELFNVKYNVVSFEDMELAEQTAVSSSGNPLNQLSWVALIGIAGYMVLRDPVRLQRMITPLLPLLALSSFALVSCIWALNGFISFRRAVLHTIVVLTIIIGVAHLRQPQQLLMILYRVAAIALLLNLVAIPMGGFDSKGFFNGIYGQKNNLGAVAMLSVFIGVAVRNIMPDRVSAKANTVFLITWIALLVISVSKTSMTLLILVPLMVFALDKLARGFRMNFAYVFGVGILTTCLLLGMVMAYMGKDLQGIVALFIDNHGFTGRDVIWVFMLEQIQHHWALGHGHGSFWGIGYDSPNIKHGRGFITLLLQGHNGYLDLLAALGVVGLGIYLAVLWRFATLAGVLVTQYRPMFLFCWILMAMSLFHNITESSIMRGPHVIWIAQLMAFALVARLSLSRKGVL